MKAPPPQLRLVAEINRVARLALAFRGPFKEEAAWNLFTTSPLTDRDRPGVLDRIFVPHRNPTFARPYGDVFQLDRSPFFSTRPIGFTAIALRDGSVAVAFRAVVERELASVVLRVAVDRLFEANGWRFPEDLVNPTAFEAICELASGGHADGRETLLPGHAATLRGEEGELPLRSKPDDGPGETRILRWTRRTLAFHSNLYGSF
ncbi:MAG TPA: hypothetical protein VI456_11830 [Polyangia bacterium]